MRHAECASATSALDDWWSASESSNKCYGHKKDDDSSSDVHWMDGRKQESSRPTRRASRPAGSKALMLVFKMCHLPHTPSGAVCVWPSCSQTDKQARDPGESGYTDVLVNKLSPLCPLLSNPSSYVNVWTWFSWGVIRCLDIICGGEWTYMVACRSPRASFV